MKTSRTCSALRSYDINVTPDKRKPFLHHEDAILEVLEEVLPVITSFSVDACLHGITSKGWFACYGSKFQFLAIVGCTLISYTFKRPVWTAASHRSCYTLASGRWLTIFERDFQVLHSMWGSSVSLKYARNDASLQQGRRNAQHQVSTSQVQPAVSARRAYRRKTTVSCALFCDPFKGKPCILHV